MRAVINKNKKRGGEILLGNSVEALDIKGFGGWGNSKNKKKKKKANNKANVIVSKQIHLQTRPSQQPQQQQQQIQQLQEKEKEKEIPTPTPTPTNANAINLQSFPLYHSESAASLSAVNSLTKVRFYSSLCIYIYFFLLIFSE